MQICFCTWLSLMQKRCCGNGIREVCPRLSCDLGLPLAKKQDKSVWFGQAFWKNFGESHFLFSRLCYWQAKGNSFHLKHLSWSFRNTSDLQYRSAGCPGALGTGWHLQRVGRIAWERSNPVLSHCESDLFFFFVTTAHKKLTAQFVFKHGHGFQRSPLIPSKTNCLVIFK